MWLANFLLLITLFFSSNINSMEKQTLQPGAYKKELVTKDGSTLRYTIYLPKLEENKKVPLILALHYGGEVTPYYGKDYADNLVIPAFKDLPAVIIAPDCPGKDWRDPKSEAAVLELLDKTIADFPINQNQMVVTGYSRGGIGTWFMASRHPKLFSAAIPVSARPIDEPDGTTPFYVIHSQDDELFALDLTEKAVEKLKAKGGKVELHVVSKITHFQTGNFAEALSKSVPWLEKLWANQK